MHLISLFKKQLFIKCCKSLKITQTFTHDYLMLFTQKVIVSVIH